MDKKNDPISGTAVAARGFPSNRMKIQTSGIMDEGWTFPEMKATQQKLCAHTDHMAVSSVDSNNKLCVVHLHIQLSIFSNGAYTAFSTLEKNFNCL